MPDSDPESDIKNDEGLPSVMVTVISLFLTLGKGVLALRDDTNYNFKMMRLAPFAVYVFSKIVCGIAFIDLLTLLFLESGAVPSANSTMVQLKAFYFVAISITSGLSLIFMTWFAHDHHHGSMRFLLVCRQGILLFNVLFCWLQMMSYDWCSLARCVVIGCQILFVLALALSEYYLESQPPVTLIVSIAVYLIIAGFWWYGYFYSKKIQKRATKLIVAVGDTLNSKV